MTDQLKSYYVIWRGDEDDFFITRLDLDPLLMAPGDNRLSNQQVVQMAFDVEYPDEHNPYVGDSPASYEMIDIFTGDNIQFVMG